MATIEQALPAWFLAKSEITDLIGDRMMPEVGQQAGSTFATLPYVTFQIISSTEQPVISDRSGFVQSRFQFTAYGSTFGSVMAVIREIKNSGITAFKGVTGGVNIRGVTIEDGILSGSESPNDGNENWRYFAEVDFMVSYLES